MEYFFFGTNKKYMYDFLYPRTTKVTTLVPEVSSEHAAMIVDCEDNFEPDQMRIVFQEKIKWVDDILKHPHVSVEEKVTAYLCSRFVKYEYDRYKREPHNSHIVLTLQNHRFYVKIFPDQRVKYCKCESIE